MEAIFWLVFSLRWCKRKAYSSIWGQSLNLLGPNQERDPNPNLNPNPNPNPNFLPLPRIKMSAILRVLAKAAGHQKCRNVKPMENEWLTQELSQSFSFQLWKPQGCMCVRDPHVHGPVATQQHQHRGTKWDTVQYTLNSKVESLWTIFYAMNAASSHEPAHI